jgi:hypothetical protein
VVLVGTVIVLVIVAEVDNDVVVVVVATVDDTDAADCGPMKTG